MMATENEHSAALTRSLTVLEQAHRVHELLNDRAISASGLTLNQALVLSEIVDANGRATVSDLAWKLGRAVHTLTAAVSGLERKKLVIRQTVRGEDRRIVRIAPTEHGRDALAQFRARVQDVVAVLTAEPFDRPQDERILSPAQAMYKLLTE